MLNRFVEQRAMEQDCISLVVEPINQSAESIAGILQHDDKAGAG